MSVGVSTAPSYLTAREAKPRRRISGSDDRNSEGAAPAPCGAVMAASRRGIPIEAQGYLRSRLLPAGPPLRARRAPAEAQFLMLVCEDLAATVSMIGSTWPR